MNEKEILAICDHTNLKIDASWEDIKRTIDEGIEYNTASVCIPGCFVKRAVEYANGKIAICTVIGFPHGNNGAKSKAYETLSAVCDGASEIDMVINIGALKSKDDETVREEIAQVKKACGDKILKVIIESGLLSDEEINRACLLSKEGGADFVKTSTGFNCSGASERAVSVMAKTVGKTMGVKASGGVRTFEDAQKMIDAGATRIGASSLVKIIKGE